MTDMLKYEEDNDWVRHSFVFHNANDNGVEIGKLSLMVSPKSMSDKKQMHLEDLLVYPMYRNQGFGTYIVKRVLVAAEQLEVNFVYALIDSDNPDQLRFFSRLGRVSNPSDDGRCMVILKDDTGAFQT